MAETSGLVQQLKWAPQARAVLVYLGPAPTATRLFLILFDTEDARDLAFRRAAAQLLGKARSAGLAVRLLHDNNSIVTGVDTWISPIRVDAIEVTQAIQKSVSLRHAGRVEDHVGPHVLELPIRSAGDGSR